MKSKVIFWGIICLLFVSGYGQNRFSGTEFLRIGFYNTENDFDPFVDTLSDYHAFDPGGDYHWSAARYRIKRLHLFKTITAMGGWHGMDVMAFAEIENRFVLDDLIKNTPLQKGNYGVIHFESADHRGIDVGMIYRKDLFFPLFSKAIPVFDAEGKRMRTRDILYVKGRVGADTLHLFINHWPSRYGGLMATVSQRIDAAKALMHVVDSVCRHRSEAHILIMGDFNEALKDSALQMVLRDVYGCSPVALTARFDFGLARGTLRTKTGWCIFDRFLCSKNLLNPNGRMLVNDKSFHIFDAAFLLEKDNKNMGWKPNRTYNGLIYHGGFSDHLPVYVDLYLQNPAK